MSARLHIDQKEYQKKDVAVDSGEELNQEEKEVAAYICNNETGDFSDILKQDSRWNIFYHLSPMRLSMFNWYEFRPNAKLLEIGGAFGALTGLFCEKCKSVVTIEKSSVKAKAIWHRHRDRENLEIYVRDCQTFHLNDKYDYIVLAGVLETLFDGSKDLMLYQHYLAYVKQFLKEDGILLLTVSNRLGLKYFCGAKEEYANTAFAGINGYPKGSKGYAFSKWEMTNILKNAGFEQMKFYYPLPDDKLPQVIYSQEYLPTGKVCDRVLPYYVDTSSLVAVESDLYEDIIQNGMFECFSNSFFIECALKDTMCDVIYAAVSTDRGKKHGFATCMHSNRTVTKTALFEEGIESLHKAYDNIMAIEKRGIKVVKHCWENNKIRMPFVKNRNFMDTLCSMMMMQDTERFLFWMDQLYHCILISSRHVDAKKNELRINSSMRNEQKELDFGVILENAYIDMVPMNCFLIDGTLYFFDQEFVRKNYPAKYVMFRSVMYFYNFCQEAETIYSMEQVKERYGLTKLWDLFLQEEQCFVSSNRNWELYANYYGWTNIDKEEIYSRFE